MNLTFAAMTGEQLTVRSVRAVCRAGVLLMVWSLLLVAAQAQRITWQGPAQVGEGETATLSLTFSDCQPRDDAQLGLPQVEGLQFRRPSTQSQFSMNGMQQSRTYSLVFPVLVGKKGTYKIPSFYVETTHGKLLVPEFTLTVGQSKTAGALTGLLVPEKRTVYVGQVFALKSVLLVQNGIQVEYDPREDIEWKPQGIAFEPWSAAARKEYSNPPSAGLERSTRCLIQAPGRVALPSTVQNVSLFIGRQSFGGFFSNPTYEPRAVRSEEVQMDVLPLPDAGKPAGFAGAVGDFVLKSTVVPQEVAVGEPITWTLTLSGTGNWPAVSNLPAREAPGSMKVLKPSLKSHTPDGKIFESEITEEVVLVPSQPGEYNLGPTQFSYFDPVSAQYKTVEAGAIQVRVSSVTNHTALAYSPPAGTTLASSSSSSSSAPRMDFSNRLPKDPLRGSLKSRAPYGGAGFWVLPVPLLAALLLWLVLAWKRSAQTDPLLPRRRARAEALEILSRLDVSSKSSLRDELPAFQRAASTLCGLSAVLPAASEIEAVLEPFEGAVQARNWRELWEEADRALYAPGGELPEGWQQRAKDLASGIRLASVPATDLFLTRNLFPQQIALIVMMLLSTLTFASAAESMQLGSGDAALDAYNSGDFETAAERWSEQVDRSPTDAALRNNLALAEAQQNQWETAAAHFTAAHLLAPRDPSIAWNYALGLDRAAFHDPVLAQWTDLSASPGVWCSPAEWTHLLWLGALFIALGFGILLLGVYGYLDRQLPLWRTAQWFIPVMGLLAILLSSYALYQYGPLANPRAGIICKKSDLYSIPSDADVQQRRPVSPGTVVVIQRSFLGWLQVQISYEATGVVKQRRVETGWIRKQQVVPFYQPLGKES